MCVGWGGGGGGGGETNSSGYVINIWAGKVLGSNLGTGSKPEWVFKGPLGRSKATISSSFSLTSNRVNTNY